MRIMSHTHWYCFIKLAKYRKVYCTHTTTKGQLISKFLYLLFFQKWMKKIYYDTSSWIVFVHFFEELRTSKRHFDINWPLIVQFIYNWMGENWEFLLRLWRLYGLMLIMKVPIAKRKSSLKIKWDNIKILKHLSINSAHRNLVELAWRYPYTRTHWKLNITHKYYSYNKTSKCRDR